MEQLVGKQFYTVEEAAKLLRVSKITVYRNTESGKIPRAKVGGKRILIPAAYLHGLAALKNEGPVTTKTMTTPNMESRIVTESDALVERIVEMVGEDRRGEVENLVYDYKKELKARILRQGQTVIEDILARGIG